MTTVRKIQPIIECSGYIRISNDTGTMYPPCLPPYPCSHLSSFKTRTQIWGLPWETSLLLSSIWTWAHRTSAPAREQILPDLGPQVGICEQQESKRSQRFIPRGSQPHLRPPPNPLDHNLESVTHRSRNCGSQCIGRVVLVL